MKYTDVYNMLYKQAGILDNIRAGAKSVGIGGMLSSLHAAKSDQRMAEANALVQGLHTQDVRNKEYIPWQAKYYSDKGYSLMPTGQVHPDTGAPIYGWQAPQNQSSQAQQERKSIKEPKSLTRQATNQAFNWNGQFFNPKPAANRILAPTRKP